MKLIVRSIFEKTMWRWERLPVKDCKLAGWPVPVAYIWLKEEALISDSSSWSICIIIISCLNTSKCRRSRIGVEPPTRTLRQTLRNLCPWNYSRPGKWIGLHQTAFLGKFKDSLFLHTFLLWLLLWFKNFIIIKSKKVR